MMKSTHIQTKANYSITVCRKMELKDCCELTDEVFTELESLYVHCFYHHLYRKLKVQVYKNCKSCRRMKILNLRPKYTHSCEKYQGNLWLAYVNFGKRCIEEIVTSYKSFDEISNEFNKWLNQKAEWRPYLLCVEFDQIKYFNRVAKNRDKLESEIKLNSDRFSLDG